MFVCQDLVSRFSPWREEELEKLLRYDGYEVMYYRPSVGFHVKRLSMIVNRIIEVVEDIFFFEEQPFDSQKALAIALVHDDPEIITGDVSVIKKDHMTPAEKAKLKRQEFSAIEELSRKLPPRFMGYNYKELLLHANSKDCVEAQLVKWLDWLDAICEITHELGAGNWLFLRPMIRSACGTGDIKKKYPDLAPLWRSDTPFFHFDFNKHHYPYVKKDLYEHWGRPHTRESIILETDFPLYDAWKKVVMEEFNEEGIQRLVTQVEGTRDRQILSLVS